MIACMYIDVAESAKRKVTFNPKLMEHGEEPPEIHKLPEAVQINERNDWIVARLTRFKVNLYR